MGIVRVAGFVATTEVMESRGIRLSPDIIHKIAEAIRCGQMPLLAQHDERLPVEGRLLTVEVRPTEAGNEGVYVEYEVDEEALASTTGFSVTLSSRFSEFDEQPDSQLPRIDIFADAVHFEEDEIREVISELNRRKVAGGGGMLFQFADLPPVLVWIATNLPAIKINLISAALYDAGKRLIQRVPGRKIMFRLRFNQEEGSVVAHVETSNPEMFKRALDTVDRAISEAGSSIEFDDDEAAWRRVRRR